MNEYDPSQPPGPWKAMKYVAGGIALVGFLLFFSVFISGALNFGNFENFDGQVRSSALRGVIGMFMMIVGIALGGIAASQSNRTGDSSGPSNDGTWRFDADENVAGPIKVRCPKCRALNDEAAKFCDQCGTGL